MRPRSAGSTWPPPAAPEDETEEERLLRLEREAEAKRVSDAIDRDIDAEREALKRRGPSMKVLLLGEQKFCVIYGKGSSQVLWTFFRAIGIRQGRHEHNLLLRYSIKLT